MVVAGNAGGLRSEVQKARLARKRTWSGSSLGTLSVIRPLGNVKTGCISPLLAVHSLQLSATAAASCAIRTIPWDLRNEIGVKRLSGETEGTHLRR